MDVNLIFFLSIILLSVVSFFSGIWFVVRSILNFRMHINQSMNMDLDVVRVSKIEKSKEEQQSNPEAWKEEIGAMEQLLSSLTTIKS